MIWRLSKCSGPGHIDWTVWVGADCIDEARANARAELARLCQASPAEIHLGDVADEHDLVARSGLSDDYGNARWFLVTWLDGAPRLRDEPRGVLRLARADLVRWQVAYEEARDATTVHA